MTSAPQASTQLDFMSRLKAETHARHDATEAIPFSKAIVEETLPRTTYVAQLVAYRTMHDVLEQALRTSTDPSVAAIWSESLEKKTAFDADIAFFKANGDTMTPEVALAVDHFVQAVQWRAQHHPTGLLGYLYVVEGSTLGGTILTQHVQSMYGLERDGVRALLPYEKNEVMPRWRAFRERMNEEIVDAATQQQIIDGACEAFDRIGEVLRALLTAEQPAPVVETSGVASRCPFGHG